MKSTLTRDAGPIERARLLDVRSFADAVGLAPVTVRRWIAQGQIAIVRLGSRSVRIPATELGRLIEEGSATASGRRRPTSVRPATVRSAGAHDACPTAGSMRSAATKGARS